MMRSTLPVLFASSLFAVLLAGCSSGKSTTCGGACPAQPVGTVYLTMTDDPPAGVQVLSFQVSLTTAMLAPESSSGDSVNLLNNIAAYGSDSPPQIDLTQLQALTTFLSTAQVSPGTYNSLTLTFANPQLVIYNQSDTSLGSGCAVGSICELTPAFDNNSSTVTFTSSPLPVTVSRDSLAGYLIDFHLNTVIQPDLTLNLSAANGVTLSALPAAPTPAQFGSLTGTVEIAPTGTDEFTLQAPWGGSFNIETTGSTTFSNFPTSACTTPEINCVAEGQILQVGVTGMATNGYSGLLTASEVDYVQGATAQTVEGTVVQVLASPTNIAGAPPLGFVMILHANPSGASGIPLGGIADVSVGSGATWSIDAGDFTMPSGVAFSGASNLAVGQNVEVTVAPGTLSTTGSGPGQNQAGPPASIAFTASGVELEPSQMTGTIGAIEAGTSSFALGSGDGSFFAPWPIAAASAFSFNVETTSGTSYTGFSPDSFDGLAGNDMVSVSGWLFAPTTSGGTPEVVAQSVVERPSP